MADANGIFGTSSKEIALLCQIGRESGITKNLFFAQLNVIMDFVWTTYPLPTPKKRRGIR